MLEGYCLDVSLLRGKEVYRSWFSNAATVLDRSCTSKARGGGCYASCVAMRGRCAEWMNTAAAAIVRSHNNVLCSGDECVREECSLAFEESILLVSARPS